MTTHDTNCTAPGRWPHPPRVDAPGAEVLAYLDHLEECSHHSTLEAERDAPLDALLHEVCGDLPALRPVPLRLHVQDREAVRPMPFTARRLMLGMAAVIAVLLAVGVAWWQDDLFQPTVAEAPTVTVQPAVPSQAVTRLERATWYEARVINDERHGQYTSSGVRYDKDHLTAAAARLAFGTRLRVFNPVNGTSVEVTVVDRGAVDGRLHLSSGAAAALDVSGISMVIVQVVSVPPPTAIGP